MGETGNPPESGKGEGGRCRRRRRRPRGVVVASWVSLRGFGRNRLPASHEAVGEVEELEALDSIPIMEGKGRHALTCHPDARRRRATLLLRRGGGEVEDRDDEAERLLERTE